MTVVTWFRKKPRLTSLIDASGGMTVLKGLREAEANTGSMRDEAMAAVDAVLCELEALTARPGDDVGAWLGRIYTLTASLLDVAGPFGLQAMCSASYSLCDLVDRQIRARRCDAPPIQVHVASLRLLSQPEPAPGAHQQVLDGLEALLIREQRVSG